MVLYISNSRGLRVSITGKQYPPTSRPLTVRVVPVKMRIIRKMSQTPLPPVLCLKTPLCPLAPAS